MNSILKFINHKLISNYGIYLGSNVLSSAIPFIFLPILTRYLSPADYGLVVTLKLVATVFSILIGVNTHGALTRAYFKGEEIDFQKYLYNLLIICSTGFLIFSLLVFGIYTFDFEFIGISQKWLLIIVVFSFFEACSKLLSSLWRAQEKPIRFGVFNILKTIVNIALSLFLVIHLDMKWQGRIIAILITGILFGAIALQSLWQNHINKNKAQAVFIDMDSIRTALRFGLPLIPHSLSGWVINYIDRFFIASMIGLSQVGVYSVAYQIGNIIGIVALSFNQAWSPFLFKQLNKNSNQIKIRIVQFTYTYFLIILGLAACVSLGFAAVSPFLVGQNFQGATQYVSWVALGYATNGMYFMVVNYIFYTEKNYYLPFITFFSAALNIVLNYVLITYNGTVGAAQATTITYAITFLITWYVASNVYRMPWNLRKAK